MDSSNFYMWPGQAYRLFKTCRNDSFRYSVCWNLPLVVASGVATVGPTRASAPPSAFWAPSSIKRCNSRDLTRISLTALPCNFYYEKSSLKWSFLLCVVQSHANQRKNSNVLFNVHYHVTANLNVRIGGSY